MTRFQQFSLYLVVSVGLASAQPAGLEIGGVALDPSGAAASGAKASLLGAEIAREASAGAGGRFRFTGLPAGAHELTVSAKNLAAESVEEVEEMEA